MSAPRTLRRAYSTARAGSHTRPTNFLELPSMKHVNTSLPDLPSVRVGKDKIATAEYTPPPVTLKTLAPLIPATAASPRGLANTLLRHVGSKNFKEYRKPVPKRHGSQEKAERQWTAFDGMMRNHQQAVVNGHHRVADQRDIIANVLEGNGTMTKKDKRKVRKVLAPWAPKMSVQSLDTPRDTPEISDKKA